MESLKKKYGLFTAVCMVVGIVIGSGIFFKAKDVLAAAGGDSISSVLAWVISGSIMVVIATTFAVMATRYERVNGAVDYAEVLCGKKYAYFVGWFMSLVYYPAMTSVLAWVSARYTLVIAGYIEAPLFAIDGTNSSLNSPECITIALFYLVLAYFVNTIAPKIAGKFQISSTVIKLVPIVLIAVVGTVIGLANGTLASNISFDSREIVSSGNTGLFPAICTTIFAYEGWIVATAINAEIKDSKKNLPLALCVGTLIIVAAYALYNIGILGLADADKITAGGTGVAFAALGNTLSAVINILVVISCLGTLNGLMLGCCRGVYSLSVRGEGVAPQIFAQVDKETNMPHNSAAFALLTCACWFVYFMFLGGGFFEWEVMNKYSFDSSELPIITLYAFYIPILISMMIKEKELHPVKRFVLPAVSLCGIAVILTACVIKHGLDIVWYLIVFALIMLAGLIAELHNRKKKLTK